MCDVWNFMRDGSIRPEAQAHVLAGVSMGGGAAFNKAIKYRDRCKIALAIFPPLNTRWMDCKGRYMANFDHAVRAGAPTSAAARGGGPLLRPHHHSHGPGGASALRPLLGDACGG